MESLFSGDPILKENAEIDAEEILQSFREFLLVFYAASWTPKSYQIAERINLFMLEQNPDDDNQSRNYEVLYISNDANKKDFKSFYKQYCEDVPWCTLRYDDSRIIGIKNELNLEALPQLLVLDRNLRVVTREGADDLLNMDIEMCRTYWCGMLARQVRLAKDADDNDDDAD